MNVFIFILLLVFMLVVVPVAIFFNYLARTRSSNTLSAEDEKLLVELWEQSTKLENRIKVLETLLDQDGPSWRSKL